MESEAANVELNLDKTCRICLEEKDDVVSIYSDMVQEIGVQRKTVIISEIIMRLSNMKIDEHDGFPQIICRKCVATAYISINFQVRCNRSSHILNRYFEKRTSTSSAKEDGNAPSSGVSLNNHEEDSGDDVTPENVETLNNRTPVDFIDSPRQERGSLNPEGEDDDTVNTAITENTDAEEAEDGFSGEVYSCNICDRLYKYKTSLTVHMKKHSSTPRRYTCKVCAVSFSKYSSLYYHNRMHSVRQPHACKICGKKYNRSTTLTAHMRVHTGHRPYLCSICGKDFRQAPDLNYHMRTHTKEKRYMCSICGKTMAMQCHLVQHMRTHTGERPFKCEDCSKAFTSSTAMKRHSIIHTGLKPYKCEVCDKSFNRQSSLKVHAKIHSDERAYACPVCDKRFIQAHTMKSHILTHSASNTSH